MTTVTQTASATIFDSVQALYDDMSKNYQSFVRPETEIDPTYKKAILDGETIYRVVKLVRGKIHLQISEFNGIGLNIVGNITHAEKIGAENDLSEYRITLENRNEPLILLACKKY